MFFHNKELLLKMNCQKEVLKENCPLYIYFGENRLQYKLKNIR